MENLDLQTQVINLGKIFVKELGLDNSVDTLSRWMAHYIAEKIATIERLPDGKEKTEIEKDCFETILKLWEHRWLLPSGNRPLDNFEPLLRLLEKIDPENEDLFFYRHPNQLSGIEIDKNNLHHKEIKEYIATIIQIDRVAKIWINSILHQAANKAKNEETKNFLENAANLPNNDDIRVVQTLLDDNISVEYIGIDEDGELFKKYQIEELQKRIGELEKFANLNKYLLEKYKKDLSEFQNNMDW